MRRRPVAVAIIALAVLPGCGGGGTKTVREPRGTLNVAKGQTLVLAFSNNPGIGFEWERSAPNPDPSVLRPRGSHSDSADRPGASVEVRYRFEGRRAGTAAIGFVHFFRGKVTERRTVRVTVR